MARLNIQLSRHGHTTTRRPRWVVWILGVCVLGFIFLQLTSHWFSRSELLIATPNDTQLILEFHATPRYQPSIQTLFQTTPLISNRSITLTDLLPSMRGKFAIFVLNNGSTAVALKTKKELLPTELLDAHRIVVQDISPSVFLLSEKLLPVSPIKPKGSLLSWMVPDLFGTRIGTIRLPKEDVFGSINLSESTLKLTLANLIFTPLKHSLPTETTSYLSTQVLPNTVIDALLDNSTNADLLKQAFSNQSWVFLTKHNESKGVLIWSENPLVFDREQLMKQLSANLNPSILEKTLQDGSIIKEIVINPDLGSIEEVTIQGKLFLHSKSEKGEEFYLSKDGELLFANNEIDLRSFLDGSGDKPQKFCGSNLLGSTTTSILTDEQTILNHESPSLVRTIFQEFTAIGAKTRINSVEFTLCR